MFFGHSSTPPPTFPRSVPHLLFCLPKDGHELWIPLIRVRSQRCRIFLASVARSRSSVPNEAVKSWLKQTWHRFPGSLNGFQCVCSKVESDWTESGSPTWLTEDKGLFARCLPVKVWVSSLRLPKLSLSQKHNQSHHCHSWVFWGVFRGVVCRITFQGGDRSFTFSQHRFIFEQDSCGHVRLWCKQWINAFLNSLNSLHFIGSSSCAGICSVTTETRWRFKFVCQILTIGASGFLVKFPETVRINLDLFVCSYFWGVCAQKHTHTKKRKHTVMSQITVIPLPGFVTRQMFFFLHLKADECSR